MLPFRARVDLGTTAMKGYSAFPKAQTSLGVISGHSLGGGSYPSAELQSVYSTALADWEKAGVVIPLQGYGLNRPT